MEVGEKLENYLMKYHPIVSPCVAICFTSTKGLFIGNPKKNEVKNIYCWKVLTIFLLNFACRIVIFSSVIIRIFFCSGVLVFIAFYHDSLLIRRKFFLMLSRSNLTFAILMFNANQWISEKQLSEKCKRSYELSEF